MNNDLSDGPKKASVVKLYGKLFLLALPFLPLIAFYFICDPDMILKKYRRFDQSEVYLGEGHVGWQNYLNNRDSIPFNSFIMGNSCTMAFRTDEWEKYLPDGSKAVRFFENAEGIAGVCQKLKALEEVDAQIDYLLIVFDVESLKVTVPSHNTNKIFSCEAAGISQLQYILRNLQTFLMPDKCIPIIEYRITGKYSPRMKSQIREGGPVREPYTNNCLNPREKEIEMNGEDYWISHQSEFHRKERCPGQIDEPAIFKPQNRILKEMEAICRKHSTQLVLVIGPDFYQKKIHPSDLKTLQDIFGKESVFDFTGVNPYTADYHHYYEPGHYRPCLGAQLLDRIYNGEQSSSPSVLPVEEISGEICQPFIK